MGMRDGPLEASQLFVVAPALVGVGLGKGDQLARARSLRASMAKRASDWRNSARGRLGLREAR